MKTYYSALIILNLWGKMQLHRKLCNKEKCLSLSLSHPPSPVPDTFYVLHELLSSVHLPPYHLSHTLPAHPPTQRVLTHSPSARRRQRAQQGASRSSADHQQGASAARAVQHLSSCMQSILPYFSSMLYVFCFTVWTFSECNEQMTCCIWQNVQYSLHEIHNAMHCGGHVTTR